MKSVVQWSAIILLLGVYAAAGWAVLHPHVSPEYRAYFIDRVSSDYGPSPYASTPEEGMVFSRAGLPNWVRMTHGLSMREGWGRWTDSNLSPTAGLTFSRAFDGNVCLDFTARAVPWVVGQGVEARFGGEQRSFRIAAQALSEYRLDFEHLHGANQLDFVLPPHLPTVKEREPTNSDPRRLAINISTLRLVPGECAGNPLLEAK